MPNHSETVYAFKLKFYMNVLGYFSLFYFKVSGRTIKLLVRKRLKKNPHLLYVAVVF